MKKMLVLLAAFLMFCCVSYAEILPEQLDNLSDAEKTLLTFNVKIAIIKKEIGEEGKINSSSLNMDLMELSLDELNWMRDYLKGESSHSYDATDKKDKSLIEQYGIDITESNEVFSKEKRAQFCLYSTIADVCHILTTVTQNNNPEIELETNSQTLDYARFYITCFEKNSKDALTASVEEYTDLFIQAICATYPNLNINTLVFFWKIPMIDQDSLYSAVYWCENDRGTIKRGEGSGALYK